VAQGEVLGRVGAPGRARGPHLHWGVNWFEVRLDPGLLVGGQ
jgi:murein DD-endopeptidase MepM/ murein hydrolase activator NlpD